MAIFIIFDRPQGTNISWISSYYSPPFYSLSFSSPSMPNYSSSSTSSPASFFVLFLLLRLLWNFLGQYLSPDNFIALWGLDLSILYSSNPSPTTLGMEPTYLQFFVLFWEASSSLSLSHLQSNNNRTVKLQLVFIGST